MIELSSKCKKKKFKLGNFIYNEGEDQDGVYLIYQGSCEYIRKSKQVEDKAENEKRPWFKTLHANIQNLRVSAKSEGDYVGLVEYAMPECNEKRIYDCLVTSRELKAIFITSESLSHAFTGKAKKALNSIARKEGNFSRVREMKILTEIQSKVFWQEKSEKKKVLQSKIEGMD